MSSLDEKYLTIVSCNTCTTTHQFLKFTNEKQYICPNCNELLFTNTKFQGFIYIIGNKSMPDSIKIGYTGRSVDERIKELSSATAVPHPFETIAIFISLNGLNDEREVHSLLDPYRQNMNREFFSINPNSAINIIREKLNLTLLSTNNKILNYYSQLTFSLEEELLYKEEKTKKANAILLHKRSIAKQVQDKELILKSGECPKCKRLMTKLRQGRGFKCSHCNTSYRR